MSITSTHSEKLLAELQSTLAPVGQQHLLRFWNQLDERQQQRLAQQILSFDWPQLQAVFDGAELQHDWNALARRCQSPPAVTLPEFRRPSVFQAAQNAGSQAIRQGQVAFVLTAGGQGTRLGFDHPKGMYPIGVVSGRTLFQIMIDHVLARRAQFNSSIPMYVMTSPLTDRETIAYLQEHRWFGFPERDIQIFSQGVMPAIDCEQKRALLSASDTMATSPDGHGGTLAALQRHGILEDMRRRGVEHIFYGQIDNPLLQVCNPALIGFHVLQNSEMTSQAIRKTDPLQRVGNFVQLDGRVQVIEYSDLPDDVACQREPNGELRLWAGSIAVHVFARSFLERMADRSDAMPFHRALKRVPFIDDQGREVIPPQPNAIKFERFIFDLLPWAERALVCEVDAAEGFAALKNAPPARTETAAWVQQAMTRLYRSWLVQAGGTLADGVDLEINPRFAIDAAELARRLPPGTHFSESTYLA